MGINSAFYKNDIIVFGAGIDGIKFAYQNKSRITHFIDNYSGLTKLKNWNVFRPTKEHLSGQIIIATTEVVYHQIALQLIQFGLVEFKDFIYYEWLYKKIAIFHGNCQMEMIKNGLLKFPEFNEKFSIYHIPSIHNNKTKHIQESALKSCDLFIHQNISSQNAFGYYLSDEYILPQLASTVTKIVVPNLSGLGKVFYPSSLRTNSNNHSIGNRENANNRTRFGLFPFADEVIDKEINSGKSIKEIIAYMNSDQAFAKDAVIDNLKQQFTYYESKEESWDIKIMDYILKQYKIQKLFYDIVHPTEAVMNEIIIRLISKLGMNASDKIFYHESENDYGIAGYETPIYPAVKKALELEYDDKYIRKKANAQKLNNNMGLEEYIKEYIWWCHC